MHVLYFYESFYSSSWLYLGNGKVAIMILTDLKIVDCQEWNAQDLLKNMWETVSYTLMSYEAVFPFYTELLIRRDRARTVDF